MCSSGNMLLRRVLTRLVTMTTGTKNHFFRYRDRNRRRAPSRFSPQSLWTSVVVVFKEKFPFSQRAVTRYYLSDSWLLEVERHVVHVQLLRVTKSCFRKRLYKMDLIKTEFQFA